MDFKLRLVALVPMLLVVVDFQDVRAGQTRSLDATCQVTHANGQGAIRQEPSPHIYGNAALAVMPWTDGIVIFKPGGPGFVMEDGSLVMKWPWWRGVQGQLKIEGHRLDASASPLRSQVACCGYGDLGFQPSYLIFPTPGCWEVTGHVADASLTFVTLVVKVGDGPARWDPARLGLLPTR
jgi:hypothetical protein